MTYSPGFTNPIILQKRPAAPPLTVTISFTWSNYPKDFLWNYAIALV